MNPKKELDGIIKGVEDSIFALSEEEINAELIDMGEQPDKITEHVKDLFTRADKNIAKATKEDEEDNLVLKKVVLYICNGCYKLKPGQCHNPDCILCRKTVKESAIILDAILVRPIVDGKVLPLE